MPLGNAVDTGKLTLDDITSAVEDSMTSLESPGFCTNCGEPAEGVEPDAREYRCDICGHSTVYGAEELLIYYA